MHIPVKVATNFDYDNIRHHQPHVHVQYQESNAVFSIKTGEIITGKIPNKCQKLIQAWIEIHKEELIANWDLAINGERVFKIRPLE